jgi:hypothetical protein
MKLGLPSQKFIFRAFSLLVALALMLSIVPSVAAGDEGPLTPIPGLGRIPNATLIRMHKQLGGWYSDQEDLLKQTAAIASKYQSLIDASAGKQHIEILQEGLATFNAEVAACREIHLVAGASIYSLTGFKSNGDVRDRLAAGVQLIDGLASLREANHRLETAMKNLHKNFAEYRHARRPAADRPYTYKYK